MARVLFLSRYEERPEYDTAELLVKKITENQASPLTYEGWYLDDLVFIYNGQNIDVLNGRTGESITKFDGVFLFGWFKGRWQSSIASAVAKIAAAKGIKTLNSETQHAPSYTKLNQQVLAVLNGVQTTPFVCSINKQYISDYLNQLGDDFPLIVKCITGARGRNNHLAKNRDDLQRIIGAPENQELHFIVQTFVPNDGDYRLLIANGEVALAIHRKAQAGTHLNNTSAGGIPTLIDVKTLDPEMVRQAVVMSQVTRREITGVDMIVHNQTGAFYLLEINNMPQIATGSFVPQKMQMLDSYFSKWLLH